ncbi:hypothetical protein KP509_07G088200 [Ceratopteris richardii]|uniref:Uncharacterized protein n=1 Tax=Ceratopteris richardii TaxID=49495 RepID=A0A8T2UEC9_CERRI|nr:hypothetical protein KP509_07G088200 [Ceratopteris richardii]
MILDLQSITELHIEEAQRGLGSQSARAAVGASLNTTICFRPLLEFLVRLQRSKSRKLCGTTLGHEREFEIFLQPDLGICYA